MERAFFCFPDEVASGQEGFFLELMSPCLKHLLALSQMNDGSYRLRIPLQDGDLSGNVPHLKTKYLCPCSGMFAERFRSVSGSVGSIEIRLVLTENPKCGTLSS